MKKITFILFALIAGTTFAQNTADATATTAAEIVEPLTITKNRDLNFGRIIGGSAGGGTVTIAATDAGTRTIPAALNALGTTNTPTSAKFTITASTYSYKITVEDTDLSAAGLTTMSYTPEHSLAPATTNSHSVDGTGNVVDEILYVGGDLTVGTDQGPGVYNGTVKVTVTYE